MKPLTAESRAVLRALVRVWLDESGSNTLPEIAALPPDEAVDSVIKLIELGYARMAYDEENDGSLINLLEITMRDTGEIVA